MKTSTQAYRELLAAQFSEPQARALLEILQAGGVVEPEPPESELEWIEQYLLAEPFQPFVIGMTSGTSYRIERRDQCGFSRHGSVQMTGVGEKKWAILNSDHIIRVKKG
ncbi:MAG TPA: hypothetical protein VE641_14980 [Chthoniobacterales bacterium]|nr:hypothetical protein [Chthoniobacterales bacterium]